MNTFTQGSTRVSLRSDALAPFQAGGSAVLDSRRTRPLWFDGRFLAARDLEREQNYFLQRQADLATAAGFGVIHGLWASLPSTGSASDAETIIIQPGQGVTPAGELVMISQQLTIRLSDLPEEEKLEVQFGLSGAPKAPARTRTGLFVLALRPVEFTAHPITSYPTSIQGSRTTRDGDIVEATAVSLVPFPDPVNAADASLRRAAVARQIFLGGNAGQLADALLPIALVSIQRGVVEWIDPYLVRRDSGPEFHGVRFGLTDPATQQAFLLQYDAQLQETIATRRTAGLTARFAAADYFQALPPAGRFPLAAINTDDFSQVFFPQQLDVRMSIIPEDELPALIEDSLSLPPIDLTLPADAYSNLAVFALVPVPRAGFAALKKALPDVPVNPVLPQVISFRRPLQLLQLYKGTVNIAPIPATSNKEWAKAIGDQKYGFYIRRRSTPAFVDFTTPPPIATTTTLTSSAASIVFGQSIALSATVMPDTASGSVQFLDGANLLGSVALSGGSASLSVDNLPAGNHTIKAVYTGDANFASSGSISLGVPAAKAQSGVSAVSSVNPSDFGQFVTLTATVTPATATGAVEFREGGRLLGSGAIGSGTATFTTASLAAGSHSIQVSYTGDVNYNGQISTLNQVVNAAITTTTPTPTTTTAAPTTTTATTTTLAPRTTSTPAPTTTPSTNTSPTTTPAATTTPSTTTGPTTTPQTTIPPTPRPTLTVTPRPTLTLRPPPFTTLPQ